MARFITGLPLVLDGGAHTMVKLKLRKDRMKKSVSLKIFNTDFFQNILNQLFFLVYEQYIISL